MRNIESILFVCLGNICRSPLAEGIARDLIHKGAKAVKIDSAGTGGYHIGEPPCERSVSIAKSRGVDIADLKARAVNPYDKELFDIFIVMDAQNYHDMVQVKGFDKERVLKLGNFGFEGNDVPDPYFFSGNEGFDIVFDMIDVGVKNIFKEFGLLGC